MGVRVQGNTTTKADASVSVSEGPEEAVPWALRAEEDSRPCPGTDPPPPESPEGGRPRPRPISAPGRPRLQTCEGVRSALFEAPRFTVIPYSNDGKPIRHQGIVKEITSLPMQRGLDF